LKLEDVTAEIRPRVRWESIDLGCALASRHIGAIWKAWVITIVPLWILLALLLRNHPFWFIVCTWWLKPIYDRVPLMVVSRALFGAVPKMKEVVKAWPKLLVGRLWFALVVGRFSPSRGLSMPISELEGLKGPAYRQRVNLLERNGGEGAVSATLVAILLEFVAGISLVMLVIWMVPSDVSDRWFDSIGDLFSYYDWTEMAGGLLWTIALVRLLSFMLMEPFYVSSGFALYVNSRTLTEGWDIELAFKRLGARLRKKRESKLSGMHSSILLTVLMGLAMMVFSPNTQAKGVLQEDISEILAADDFTVYDRIVEVPKETNSDSSSWLGEFFSGLGIPSFMGVVGTIMFYLVLMAIIAGLIWLIVKNRHVFSSSATLIRDSQDAKTHEIMGMDVAPESLPDDVVAAARETWGQGDYKLALSLLYRGSITWFVFRDQLSIEESDTEGDCLRRVEALGQHQYADYFSSLTDVWILAAYGKQQPDNHTMVTLCDNWPFSNVKQERGRQ